MSLKDAIQIIEEDLSETARSQSDSTSMALVKVLNAAKIILKNQEDYRNI